MNQRQRDMTISALAGAFIMFCACNLILQVLVFAQKMGWVK